MIRNKIDAEVMYILDGLTREQYLACLNYLVNSEKTTRRLFKDETSMNDVIRYTGNIDYDGESYRISVYASTKYLYADRKVDGEQFDVAEAFMQLREGIKTLKEVMKDLTEICEEL